MSLTWDAPIFSGKDVFYLLNIASEQEEKALSAQRCVGIKDHHILAAPTSCCPVLLGITESLALGRTQSCAMTDAPTTHTQSFLPSPTLNCTHTCVPTAGPLTPLQTHLELLPGLPGSLHIGSSSLMKELLFSARMTTWRLRYYGLETAWCPSLLSYCVGHSGSNGHADS